VIGALDRLYRWITGHRVFAGALMFLGAMFFWQLLIDPLFSLLYLTGIFEGHEFEASQIWLDARRGFFLIGLGAIWLIGLAYLLRSGRAFKQERIGINKAARSLFFLKRGAAFFFLGYLFLATLLYFGNETWGELGWFVFFGFTAAAIFVGGIALLAILAERSRVYWKVDSP
jgi:hypothetical protein